MPEANVLYSVTAAVIVGLVAWVAIVLKTAKEPWARPALPNAVRIEDVPLEGNGVAITEVREANADADAEEKADAKAEEKAEAKAEAKAEEKAEEKAE
jgi:hypothetical protein